ncbi:MAG: OmpH family outer membrane protein, partial [Acidobacteriota bacterium]
MKELFRHMKRALAIVFALASGMVLSASAQAPATAAAPAGPTKVAVIAFQAAVAQTNEFQRNYADLEKKFEPKRQQLKTESDEIDNLTKQL